MRHNFVTVCDSGYLAHAFSLFSSLELHTEDFHLWLFVTDEVGYELASKEKFSSLSVLRVQDFASQELLNLRASRSLAEFHWTLTPYLFGWVFQASAEVSVLTYLDADTFFLGDPDLILREFHQSSAAVMITEHAYSPAFDQSSKRGRFCVQFIPVKRTLSDQILELWARQCFDWCFSREKDGKFGDQKYLDEWPSIWQEKVSIASPADAFQGPWNASRFRPENAILYHFHGLIQVGPRRWSAGSYPTPRDYRSRIYKPYFDCLTHYSKMLTDLGLPQRSPRVFRAALAYLRRLARWAKLWLFSVSVRG